MSTFSRVALVVLVATLAVSASQVITVNNFQNGIECTGNTTTETYPAAACFPARVGSMYQSAYVTCPSLVPQCFSFWTHAGAQCDNITTPYNTVECNKCRMSSDPKIGMYKFQCFQDRNEVQAYDNCNADCSQCNASLLLQIGMCAQTNSGNLLPAFIEECARPQCVYFFPDAGPKCSNADNRIASECGKCLQKPDGTYYAFYCGGVNGEVLVNDKCNSDCSTCAVARTFQLQTCDSYDNGAKMIFIDTVAPCGGTRYLFKEPNCAGNATITAFEVDKCWLGVRPVCEMAPDSSSSTKAVYARKQFSARL